MSSSVRAPLQCLVAVAFAVGAVSACGGSSSKSSAGGTPTTSAATSTTTGEAASATVRVSDAAAVNLAIQQSDVGSGFVPYRKAGGVQGVGAKSCSVTVPGAVLTTKDHVYLGPMFKKNDAPYFAYSEVYVFRTEQLAQKYAAFRATKPFMQCKQRQDNAVTRDGHPGLYVKLTPMSYRNPSGHIPTVYRELTGSTSNGKQVDDAFYDRYTVVTGPVVVVVSIDSSLAPNDAASAAVARQTGDILRTLDTTLPDRVAGVASG